MSNVVLRNADVYDIPWIVREAGNFLKHIGREECYNPDYLYELAPKMLEQRAVLVAEMDGKLCGIIAATVQPHPFNPHITVVAELMWWVVEECRGSSVGYRLLKALEARAKQLNADLLVMSTEMNSPLSTDALEKRGYTPQDKNYVKRIV